MLMNKCLFSIAAVLLFPFQTHSEEPFRLASRLEMFTDDRLIDRLEGDVAIHLQRPQPREVVLVTGEPWEGNTSAYYTIFQDGDLFRMYYRGSHYDTETQKATHREVTCYAESKDGIRWTKPNLGIFEWEGSSDNNIVWDGVGCHNFTPFKDTNPNCPPEQLYKALGRENRPGMPVRRLFAFKSPDGIHWSLLSDKPVISEGAFDSQNLAFWDSVRGEYREYHRTFHEGIRDIQTSTTKDFSKWPSPKFLIYPHAPKQHLYTNAIQPYYRAPHIFIGFPTRYLPEEGQRVEPILMTSRNGVVFHRWNDPVIPESAPEDRAGNRSNYMAWGMIPTPGTQLEISVYATEAYYEGPNTRLRRFSYRTDGFTALNFGKEGGRLISQPLTFTGDTLELNLDVPPTGSLQVSLLSNDGQPIPGFEKDSTPRFSGGSIKHELNWPSGSLKELSGKPIRIQFEGVSANVFAFRFR